MYNAFSRAAFFKSPLFQNKEQVKEFFECTKRVYPGINASLVTSAWHIPVQNIKTNIAVTEYITYTYPKRYPAVLDWPHFHEFSFAGRYRIYLAGWSYI